MRGAGASQGEDSESTTQSCANRPEACSHVYALASLMIELITTLNRANQATDQLPTRHANNLAKCKECWEGSAKELTDTVATTPSTQAPQCLTSRVTAIALRLKGRRRLWQGRNQSRRQQSDPRVKDTYYYRSTQSTQCTGQRAMHPRQLEVTQSRGGILSD